MMSLLQRWIGRSAAFGLCLTAISLIAGGCAGGVAQEGTNLDDGDFLNSGRTLSHFTAIQVDPRSEDSAGPQFVVAADLNNDGFMDLVSAWNQSQPVQIHLQLRSDNGNLRFETLTLAGSVPVVSVAGLGVADFDNDGRQDIAVLIKDSALSGAACLEGDTPPGTGLSGVIVTYFGPDDPAQVNQALAWNEVLVGNSLLQGRGDSMSGPELSGYTAMVVGDVDGNGGMDLVAAWNSDCGGSTASVVVFSNPGPNQVRDGTWTAAALPDAISLGTMIKSVALGDIDRDGDLDVAATFPDAPAMNVRWYRNPAIDLPDDFHIADGQWQSGSVGQLATGADVIQIGDIDRDAIADIVVRSTNGALIQWLKGPAGPTTSPVRSIPWQVYTLGEFKERVPEAFALGDVNFDGQLEVVVGAEGGLLWFDSRPAQTVYDQWSEVLIVDDLPPGRPSAAPPTTDPTVEPADIAGTTFINSILVVDLDDDGANDIVATLDRSGLSGVTNDALVWFRNTRRPPN